MQWVGVDKNEVLKSKSSEPVEPRMKSRMVARGDLQEMFGRSDSPTADKEAMFVLPVFATSKG